jgi:hypothetical protein
VDWTELLAELPEVKVACVTTPGRQVSSLVSKDTCSIGDQIPGCRLRWARFLIKFWGGGGSFDHPFIVMSSILGLSFQV